MKCASTKLSYRSGRGPGQQRPLPVTGHQGLLVSTSRLRFFREMLRSPSRFSRQAWGYLAFWLYAIGLSSIIAFCFSVSKPFWSRSLSRDRGRFRGQPEHAWAFDASGQLIAVVAPTQIIYKGTAFAENIFENELF